MGRELSYTPTSICFGIPDYISGGPLVRNGCRILLKYYTKKPID